jgi:hypothetical protein
MTIDKEFLDKVYDKQERMADDITEIKITLVEQHASLKEHIRRSDLLEEHLELVRAEIAPVQAHVNKVQGAVKLAFGISGLVALLAGIIRIIEFIRIK